MRTGVAVGTIAPVNEDTVTVVLELEPGDPISGRALREGSIMASFSGWLELYAALESTRAPAADGEPTGSGQQ